MSELRMPSLGADMDFGTVIEWRVEPGDRVARGDIVLLVDTDKAEIEVESWQGGTVERILVAPGEKVPVGAVLAILRPADEAAPAPGPVPAEPKPAAPALPIRDAAPPSASEPARVTPKRVALRPTPSAAGRIHATPLARRLARDLGVDLARLAGTGIDGAIVADDVRAAVPQRAAAPAPAAEASREAQYEREPATPLRAAPVREEDRQASLRRRIAAAMERSKREIPHYYLQADIDTSRALAWLVSENQRRTVSERILPAALLLRAVVRGLAATPELNGHWVDGALRPVETVHLGVVVSLRGGGVLVPTIRDAHSLSLGELMRALREATNRARRGTLRSADVSEATITVTNLGEAGVESVFGILYPPQVALVGFGRIRERPWAENGLLGVRPVLTATLSADHRASDGVVGARLLAAIDRALQDPEET